MTRGGGKRRRNDLEDEEQVMEDEVGLVSDTSSSTRTFQEIYENFSSGPAPDDVEERIVWLNVKHSGLPKIAARPAILPYRDMILWILSRCSRDGTVKEEDGSTLVSFTPKNFSAIYKMPVPEVNADEAFVKKFTQEFPDFHECIREWWNDPNRFKTSSPQVYRIQNFNPIYQTVAVMLCRLMGEKNCNIFRRSWVPYMHVVVEKGTVLNWSNILSDVIIRVLRKYVDASENAKPPFYMSAYLLDMICAQIDFRGMYLKWTPGGPPVCKMFSILWLDNFIPHIYKICSVIFPNIHMVLFGVPPQRISRQASEAVKGLGHWYLQEYFTIIRIAGNEEVHYLPWFVPDMLVLREIAFQTVLYGAHARLVGHQKKPWPRFPITVGRFLLANRQHAEKQVQEILKLQLWKAPHRFYDPSNAVSKAFGKLLCPGHFPDSDEEHFEDAFNHIEVLEKFFDKEGIAVSRAMAVKHMTEIFTARDNLLRSTDSEKMQAEQKSERIRRNRWEKAVLIAKKKREQEAAQAFQSRKTLPPFKGTRSSSATIDARVPITATAEVNPSIPPCFPAGSASHMQSQAGSNPSGKEAAPVQKIVILDSDVDSEGGKTRQKNVNGAQAIPSAQVFSPGFISPDNIIVSDKGDLNSLNFAEVNPRQSSYSVARPVLENQQIQNLISEKDTNMPSDDLPNSETEQTLAPERVVALNSEGNISGKIAIQPTGSQPTANTVEPAAMAADNISNLRLTRVEVEKAPVQESALAKSDFGVQPLEESHLNIELDVLSTAPVGADDTVISFGDYFFDKQSNAVIRRKSNKTNEMIIWSSTSEKPEVRMLDSASAMGAFAVMNMGAAEDTHKEMESLRAQLVDIQNSLREAEAQVQTLQNDLVISKCSQFDVEIFRREALEMNEETLAVHTCFCELLDSVQDLYNRLASDEEIIDQQKEELMLASDIYETISDHQRQYVRVPNIKYFTPLELKKLKLSLSSGEGSMEEAFDMIGEARKDCDKIWRAARKLISEARLPLKDGKDADPLGPFKMDVFRRRYLTRRDIIIQMVDVSWEDLELFLIDEKGAQAEIKTWTNQVEITLKKGIMRKLCNAEFKLENYRPEKLVPLLQSSDQWKQFLDQREIQPV